MGTGKDLLGECALFHIEVNSVVHILRTNTMEIAAHWVRVIGSIHNHYKRIKEEAIILKSMGRSRDDDDDDVEYSFSHSASTDSEELSEDRIFSPPFDF